MNKPLVIVLVLVLAGLGAWKVLAPATDTRAVQPVSGPRGESGDMAAIIGGVETDEEPEFDVQLEAMMEGNRSVLDFTITETHGWAAKGVLVRIWHKIKDPETGEWIEDPDFETNPFVCNKPLQLGKPLIYRTVLADAELNQLPDRLMGSSEEWGAEIVGDRGIFKPAK